MLTAQVADSCRPMRVILVSSNVLTTGSTSRRPHDEELVRRAVESGRYGNSSAKLPRLIGSEHPISHSV